MLRAIRQCAELNFTIEEKTSQSLIKNFHLIKKNVKQERIIIEIAKLLKTNNTKMIEYIYDNKLNHVLDFDDSSLKPLLLSSGLSLSIRFACALTNTKIEKKDWDNYKLMMILGKDVEQKFIQNLDQDLNSISLLDKLSIKKFIQKNHPYTLDIITYHTILRKSNGEPYVDLFNLSEQIGEFIDIIKSEYEVKLTGNKIIELFGLKKQDIKKLKLRLFENITKGNVPNLEQELINYIKLNYIG